MSLSSKLALIVASGISASIIIYVHFKQDYDRDKLHVGVLKDIERQRRRQIENMYVLQQQAELTKEYQKDLADKNKSTIVAQT